MMLGLPTSNGLRGIQTCDMVVDGNGNAVDCSSVLHIFSSACWNPLAPCAAVGAVDGQPTTVDCSKSQLGTVGCNVVEQQGTGAGGTSAFGIPWGAIMVAALGIGGLLIWDAMK